MRACVCAFSLVHGVICALQGPCLWSSTCPWGGASSGRSPGVCIYASVCVPTWMCVDSHAYVSMYMCLYTSIRTHHVYGSSCFLMFPGEFFRTAYAYVHGCMCVCACTFVHECIYMRCEPGLPVRAMGPSKMPHDALTHMCMRTVYGQLGRYWCMSLHAHAQAHVHAA